MIDSIVTQNTSADACIFLNDDAPISTVAPHPEIEAYQSHGWKLCSVKGKDAHIKGWNRPGNELRGMPLPNMNVGLCHAYSGTCALDIDDMGRARNYLLLHGVDLDALLNAPDAVRIISREGRGKLLYSLPTPRPTKTVHDGEDMVLELRSGTKRGLTVQDVLPPSIHPDTGKPYTWGGAGDWKQLPPLPAELITLWDSLSLPDAPVRVIDSSVQMPLAPIREALAAIHPDAGGYKGWLDIGMACHSEGDHLFDDWFEWSSRSRHFDAEECEDKWRSFTRGDSGNISIDTLGYRARKEAEWKAPTDWTKVVKTRKDEVKEAAEEAASARYAQGIFTPDEQFMLDNIYTLKEGSTAYYDVEEGASFSSAARFDASYGKLALGPTDKTKPSRWLAQQNDCKVVTDKTWSPVPDDEVVLEGRTYVNTYQPIKIIQKPNLALIKDWLDLCEHILGDHKKLGLQYMAFMLQHPETKVRWAVLVHGAPRTGKDFILQPLKLILGSAFKVISPKNLREGWGDAYVGAKFITFAEVKDIGSDRFNALKSPIADDDVEQLNPKGKGIVNQKNLYGMWFNSNHDDCMKFSTNQDKILVIRSPEGRMDPEFYDRLGKDKKRPEFAQAAYHYLMNMDLSDFTSNAMPERTEAMYAMCDAARGSAINGLIEAGETRSGPFSAHITNTLAIREWVAGQRFPDTKTIASEGISEVLEAIGWARYRGHRKIDGKVDKTPMFMAPTVDCWWMRARELHDYYGAE